MKRKRILLIILFLLVISLTGCNKKDYSISDYKLDMEYKENFKIIQLTDLHWGIEMDYEYEIKHLKKMIDNANNPDLIVITGDSFLFANKKMVDKFVEFFDSLNIKWTFTHGNHDQQGNYDYYYINEKIGKAKNSVFIDYKDDNLSGLTNFYINLNKDGDTLYRLYVIDSGCYHATGIRYGYGIIEEDQLEHIKNINKTENDSAKSLMFFHIPLMEYDDAYDSYGLDNTIGFGEKRENSCPGYINSGAYNVFKEIGAIATFCGHDHVNDYSILYNNEMIISYGVKSSDLVYHDNDMIGYKEIILPLNPNNFNLSSIRNVMVPYEE